MSRKIPKAQTNCKDGLTSKQEIEARRLKNKLLDDTQRSDTLKEVSQIWEEYQNISFDKYFKLRAPALYSACKRADVLIEVREARPMLVIK